MCRQHACDDLIGTQSKLSEAQRGLRCSLPKIHAAF